MQIYAENLKKSNIFVRSIPQIFTIFLLWSLTDLLLMESLSLFRWAKLTAGVFVRHGVPVYLFTTTTPTPFVPFSIKQVGSLWSRCQSKETHLKKELLLGVKYLHISYLQLLPHPCAHLNKSGCHWSKY